MDAMKLFDLSGKVAVVTGGAGLYGKQIISALSSAGATVYMASRNREKNAEVAKEFSSHRGSVIPEEVDLLSEKSILSLCDRVYEKEGRVDILVNNAVLRCTSGYTDSSEAFEKSMSANATGLFIISRAFGDRMAKENRGSIINIGSYMGILGPDYSLYEGTGMNANGAPGDYFFHKGGMTNYTKFLAGHYGEYNIRCNCLELGGLYNGQPEEFVRRYSQKTMLGRMANETDLMGAIIYLASDASAYVTGAIIPVDGGYSAK
ncbi:MAG: SDR family oxidoreductase [Oscillospiraceae bacterium]|nr:SDR family oxidoreductase [Oscillospiraceae bacterium]